jgi:hypothetical protein
LGHLPKQCFPGGYLFLSNLMEDALLLMSLAQICHGVEQNFHPQSTIKTIIARKYCVLNQLYC